jgi:4-amino-4-deoxy-L-arabinose transferase-like glycosyltransferase
MLLTPGPRRSFSVARALLLLTVIAVAVRAGMFLVYQPVVHPDTNSYFTLASQLLHFDFSDYNGMRTPGYSFLLLLAGQDLFVVWLMQSAMGVLISLLLFWISFTHTGNASWSFVAGLLHSLALNQLLFEADILSETFSTFLVVLSVVCLVSALKNGPRPGYGVAAGVVAALVTVTRVVYVYVGPAFVLLVLLFERDARRLAAGLGVAFLLPVLGWAAFNKVTVDYFGLTTMVGYNLTNHSGGFMEKAGDEHATIRDIYLKYREQKIAERGTHSMTIFIAKREMLEKTGLDEVALSRQLTKLSLQLFVNNPALYLRSVAESWVSFWAAPIYMRSDQFSVPGAARAVGSVWRVERMLFLMLNVLAILASAWVVISAVVRRLKGTTGLPIPLIVTCVVMGASVLQAFVESGENARYGIPTQSLAATLVLLVAWDIRSALRARSAAAALAHRRV